MSATPQQPIHTEHIYPPIPLRHFDWMAWRGDYEPGVTTGYGATREQAVQELLERESMQEDAP